MGRSSGKGSSFERHICKALSLWWTDGRRDDVFWRTAASGGRATNRAKQGQKTAGAYGDITALDAIGTPLLRLCCFELKRGYGSWGLLDLVDKPEKGAVICRPEEFWLQARKSAQDAGVPYPVVIFKRDRRKECIILPRTFLQAVAPYAGPNRDKKLVGELQGDAVVVMRLFDFLEYCPADHIRSLYDSSGKI